MSPRSLALHCQHFINLYTCVVYMVLDAKGASHTWSSTPSTKYADPAFSFAADTAGHRRLGKLSSLQCDCHVLRQMHRLAQGAGNKPYPPWYVCIGAIHTHYRGTSRSSDTQSPWQTSATNHVLEDTWRFVTGQHWIFRRPGTLPLYTSGRADLESTLTVDRIG